MPNPRVLIYGSCVTRDALELSDQFTLVDYFARTSLGSAFRPVPRGWDPGPYLAALPSNFQRRMVETDLRKRLAHELTTQEYDFLLLDFIDERMSIIEFADSTITESAELKSTGFPISPEASFEPWSPLGTQRRFDGIRRLHQVCDASTMIVNKVYWATHDNTGAELPNRSWIDKNNAILDVLYDEMAKTPGVRFVTYPQGLVADAKHQWGPQPYHYTRELNEHYLAELATMTG